MCINSIRMERLSLAVLLLQDMLTFLQMLQFNQLLYPFMVELLAYQNNSNVIKGTLPNSSMTGHNLDRSFDLINHWLDN